MSDTCPNCGFDLKKKYWQKPLRQVLAEWVTCFGAKGYSTMDEQDVRAHHKRTIKEAFKEGNPIPDDVLADYPELR